MQRRRHLRTAANAPQSHDARQGVILGAQAAENVERDTADPLPSGHHHRLRHLLLASYGGWITENGTGDLFSNESHNTICHDATVFKFFFFFFV